MSDKYTRVISKRPGGRSCYRDSALGDENINYNQTYITRLDQVR